jgi:sec-independent protein translocase protein TatB
MGSLGTGEVMVIILVALIVFGPHRLPEITRKAGEWLAKARQMSRLVTDSIDAEYGEIAAPIKELKGEYDATMREMKGIASSLPDLSVELPTIELKPYAAGKTVMSDAAASNDAVPRDVPEPPEPDAEAS